MPKVGFEALEVTVMAPLALTADWGVNIVLNVTLAPGLSTSGTLSPAMLYPAPVTETPEIVTLAPPVFVKESIKARLSPTRTSAKFRLVGLAES